MSQRLKTTPLRLRPLERAIEAPVDIDPAKWNRAVALVVDLDRERLCLELNAKKVLPLLDAWDEVPLLRSEVEQLRKTIAGLKARPAKKGTAA